MPAIVNWLLRLIITNPICVRLVSGGSKRVRHMYIRSAYLAVMVIALLFQLMTSQTSSLQSLASAGANAFMFVAYLQLAMICLLAPVFMAGAISQEANPKTWDIMLTTPLNSLQVVLGNLFGRLFFILALLFSSLPLFAITQYFGGVPGKSIFLSYMIGSIAALVVGSIAIALSVSRQAGRRAVFLFYITVVIYLATVWSVDRSLQTLAPNQTTWMTPLNPFLATQVLVDFANYHPPSAVELLQMNWLQRQWFGSPVSTFCWIGVISSILLIGWSSIFLRVIGEQTGQNTWIKRLFFLHGGESKTRPPRNVWNNPIAWREASAKQSTFGKRFAKWGFVSTGVLIALILLIVFHTGNINLATVRSSLLTILAIEVGIIGLTALNISATAISQEREDGTLDQLLTTPLTPSYYISGKLRGIVSFLLPMIAVPVATMLIFSIYILMDGLAIKGGVMLTVSPYTDKITIPFMLPEGVIVLPFVLVPFTAFCVMVGLNWSLKCKSTISSVITAVSIVVAVVGVISLCGFQGGNHIGFIGVIVSTLSPLTAIWSLVYPEKVIPQALSDMPLPAVRIIIIIASICTATVYTFVVYGMHKAMLGTNGKNFDMTVRKLAGTN